MTEQASPNPPAPAATIDHIDAFETTRQEREALAPEALLPIFADIPQATSRVLAVVERAASYDAALATLPLPPDVRLRAQRSALAAAHANVLHLAASEPTEDLTELVEEIRERRATLLSDVNALVRRSLLNAEPLNGLSNSTGRRASAYDVMLLCTMLRAAWPTLSGKTAVTLEEIDQAHRRAEHLAYVVALREDGDRRRGESAETRTRAFTLMVRDFEQLRRGLTFLEWGNDALLETLAPSVQSGRPRRAKPDEPSDSGPDGERSAPSEPSPGKPRVRIPDGMPGSEPTD